jgi:hypothetical protein
MKEYVDPWNDPDLNPEPGVDKKVEESQKKAELDFVEVINLIIKYYHPNNELGCFMDSSESWKRDDSRKIPEDLDHIVKKAFIRELRKFY